MAILPGRVPGQVLLRLAVSETAPRPTSSNRTAYMSKVYHRKDYESTVTTDMAMVRMLVAL